MSSQIPRELRSLSTILRPEHVYTSVAAAEELRSLTGFALAELVSFRPQRLALHELLIRISADLVVPDGPRIEDLGINFRRMATRLWSHHLAPRLHDLEAIYAAARGQVSATTERAVASAVSPGTPSPGTPSPGPRRPAGSGARAAGGRALFGRLSAGRARLAPASAAGEDWGAAAIAACTRELAQCADPLERLVHRTLVRVLTALSAAHGQLRGVRELIVALVCDAVCNEFASDAIGAAIDPLMAAGARAEGYDRLPPQERPCVINTKGPSASGKSTLRPLQKRLAARLGVQWRDFALISPDIWRKQLLDYSTLGAAYKYAGAFTADELQIIDQKLDRYMAHKYRNGGMSHLLIDRFRFESFAPDSDEAGSNFLTRFGDTVYLFFVLTPPEALVERAWKRGLEVGRYKAVDDTLAHAVEAYGGIPNVFFTWIGRSDKRIRFEFLDNTVPLGESPRTVAFGDNETIHVLDVPGMLNLERYGRICVEATSPEGLYPDRTVLAPERNAEFLRRCVRGFRHVRFARQASGRIYLEMEHGVARRLDRAALATALEDPDTRAALAQVAREALDARAAIGSLGEQYLKHAAPAGLTLGQWGQVEAPSPSGALSP